MVDPLADPLAPAEILAVLREHCLPQPISSHLPSTLRLAAHLTLVSDAIDEQAAAAIRINDICKGNSKLSDEEIHTVHDLMMKAVARSKEMRVCSLEIRRAHLRMCIASQTVATVQRKIMSTLGSMIESYFPALPRPNKETDPDVAKRAEAELKHATQQHNMLFIQYIDTSTNEVDKIAEYRKETEDWVGEAERGREANKRWIPPRGRPYAELVKDMLAMCEGVVSDAETLMAIFDYHAEE